jgi:hypothetical protein
MLENQYNDYTYNNVVVDGYFKIPFIKEKFVVIPT